ncbi:MAG TPA: exonuclease domain-containing protein [Gaiellaceae bacterium]|nr:exonuclease domain-containing protein [Gaiellaceae bacterium]
MQLAFDSADRLVELVEERRAPVAAEEAARRLFALASAPAGLARELLDDVVSGDARLAWRGGAVALASPPGSDLLLEDAVFAVVDLETTGLSPERSRICELGAVRVRALELDGDLQTFVNPGGRLPVAVSSLTGIRDAELRAAPSAEWAVRRFLDFAGDAVLVAHNARFDLAFLDREVGRLTGRRLAGPVVDTVSLARRLLEGRVSRFGLASLAWFFGTSVQPCHRALPDAQATAEVLLGLIGLAQERGARTVAELADLSAPRARRVYAKRSLVHGAPPRPGVYLFRDANEVVLYVGRARDLRARLRSYFRSDRQRPAVEAALAAVERIEWRVLGSELEAALEELRLIRELRPPANARGKRGGVYLRRRGRSWVVSEDLARLKLPADTPVLGPVHARTQARLAARALGEHDSPEEALASARARVARLSHDLRFEDAARHRDRLAALEAVLRRVRTLERLRRTSAVLLVPAAQDGFTRAFFVREGRVAAVRTLPPGAGARLELEAGVNEATRAELPPEDGAELLLVAQFLRRPPPELRVLPFAQVARVAA